MERFQDYSSKTKPKVSNSQDSDFLIFGYTCKLYRDDQRADWINNGHHLIKWIGDHDEKLLIDRYDVRGYLNDLSPFNEKNDEVVTEEEANFEKILNEERFLDLKENDCESIKGERSPTPLSIEKKQYSTVSYSYDNVSRHSHEEFDDFQNDYELPKGLSLPDHILKPKSMKQHSIIEKTAEFVAQQGLQMEILLKTKQARNSKFDFLSIDSELNTYYKYLLNEIKSGRYKKTQLDENHNDRKDSNSDSDSDDDNYLHPSLLQSHNQYKSINSLILPNLIASNDSYSKLVDNFKEKSINNEVDSGHFKNELPKFQRKNCKEELSCENPVAEQKLSNFSKDVSSLIPKPPPDIEVIIEKLAEHVGKNGENFEQSIRALNDSKFDFLNKGHKYHAYYVKRKIHFMPSKCEKSSTKSLEVPKAIAFAINNKLESTKMKLNNIKIDNLDPNRFDEICDQPKKDSGTCSKEKQLQEIRKKKTKEFLILLKKSNMLDESKPKVYGPALPKSDSDIALSPTIERVTSPIDLLLSKNSKKEENEDTKNINNEGFDDSIHPAINNKKLSLPKRYQESKDSKHRRHLHHDDRSKRSSKKKKHKESRSHRFHHHDWHDRSRNRSSKSSKRSRSNSKSSSDRSFSNSPRQHLSKSSRLSCK
ncbi:zinc transporter ZIP9 [Sarcoptes scabiei]|nr:zinc transporter ZIP9 [Sarcoptes scabiei]